MAILKDLTVNGPSRFIGDVQGISFKISGGTSNQFLKADGSVDNSVYLESNQIAIASNAEIDDLFSDDSGSGI